MSNKTNKMIGDANSVEVNPLDPEELAVAELFLSFGASLESASVFLENGYRLETLRVIQRKEVEELLPPPNLADRTKVLNGLNAWRLKQGAPAISCCEHPAVAAQPRAGVLPVAAAAVEALPAAAAACQAGAAPPAAAVLPAAVALPAAPEVTREQCNATHLLNLSTKGRALLAKYEGTEKYIPRTDLNKITHIVVDEFLDRFKNIHPNELSSRATELAALFPGVPQETWYKPAKTTNSGGKKVRIKASGRLYNRKVNYMNRGGKSDNEEGAGGSPAEELDRSEIFSAAQYEEYKSLKTWFEHNTDEWEELKNRWRQSCAIRLWELFKLEERSLDSILNVYPVLKHACGYQLIQIDFEHKFSEKHTLLFERWDSLVAVIRDIFEVDVSDAHGKALLESVDKPDVTDDTRHVTYTQLLTHILKSAPIASTSASKKRWKPSIQEAKEHIVLAVSDYRELEETLSRLTTDWTERNQHPTPLIIAQGNPPTNFTVWHKSVSYKLPSFVKSLDVCLKIFKVYELDFPVQSEPIWEFLAYFLLEFKPRKDHPNVSYLYKSIHTMLKDD